jgi:hypothetical protein
MRFSQAIQLFVPQPSPFQLVRIGGAADGAYLIPDDLDGIIACFSPGASNTKAFEDELALSYGIRSHICDFSSEMHRFETPFIPGMQTFEKKWLDVVDTSSTITLANWTKSVEGGEEGDFILQMDIEGAEYRNLLAAPSACIQKFRIIVLELHSLGTFDGSNSSLARRCLGHTFLQAWLPVRRKLTNFSSKYKQLENLAYRLGRYLEPCLIGAFAKKLHETHVCIHAHANNCCGEFILTRTGQNIPRVLELTFLRRDRFVGRQSQLISPKLPHPLDIVNDINKPPIALNSYWG